MLAKAALTHLAAVVLVETASKAALSGLSVKPPPGVQLMRCLVQFEQWLSFEDWNP